MCARCEELEEENRALRRELSYELDRSKLDRLRSSLGMSPCELSVLWSLYSANGRVVSPAALDALIPAEENPDRDLQVFKVWVNRIRKRLGAKAIETHWGRGYSLTDLGRLLVNEALEAPARRAA